MTKWLLFSLISVLFLNQSCNKLKNNVELILPSPDFKIHLYFNLNNGEPYYLIYYKDRIVVDWSLAGINLNNGVKFTEGLYLYKTESFPLVSINEIKRVNGLTLSENYNELRVCLKKENLSDDQMTLVFRAYNEGIAFAYLFPPEYDDPVKAGFIEGTQFDLYGKVSAWKVMGNANNPAKREAFQDDESKFLIFPVSFMLEEGISMTIAETNSPAYPVSVLIKRDSLNQSFSIGNIEYSNSDAMAPKSITKIPWRVIFINENHEKSSNWN